MTSTPPAAIGTSRAHLTVLPGGEGPTPLDMNYVQPSDEYRIAAAKLVARSTQTGREVLDRLEADGVEVELVDDRDFAERHGILRAARRMETSAHQTEQGVIQLKRKTVIAIPWTTMLRPREGALALVHEGTHHVMDTMIDATAALTQDRREQHARKVRAQVEAELSRPDAARVDPSPEAIARSYRRWTTNGEERPRHGQ